MILTESIEIADRESWCREKLNLLKFVFKSAKKRKEEEAKMKSLIGDGKYTVSSNNGEFKTVN